MFVVLKLFLQLVYVINPSLLSSVVAEMICSGSSWPAKKDLVLGTFELRLYFKLEKSSLSVLREHLGSR